MERDDVKTELPPLLKQPVAASASRRIPAPALGGLFVLLWSLGYPAAKIALEHSAPFTVLVFRMAGAGLIYFVLALFARVGWPNRREALHSAVVGALSLAAQFGGIYFAVSLGVNVGIAALVIGSMPIATALLGRLLGNPIRSLQWIGFVFGIVGVALVVSERLQTDSANLGLGACLGLLVGLLGISGGTLYQKRFGSNIDLRSGLAIQHLSALALVLPFAIYEGFRFDISATFAGSLTWIILGNSVATFALFFVLLRRGEANKVATLFFLMPPVTALLDYFIFGDTLSMAKIAGFVLAALGVWLATRDPQPANRV